MTEAEMKFKAETEAEVWLELNKREINDIADRDRETALISAFYEGYLVSFVTFTDYLRQIKKLKEDEVAH
ncbi:MAG: hypothetical protein DHS20C07_19260 [Methyloligella sp.]|nr:MAG: hypothetical protein DHS20C07_19260 [Methyloligella sp.]